PLCALIKFEAMPNHPRFISSRTLGLTKGCKEATSSIRSCFTDSLVKRGLLGGKGTKLPHAVSGNHGSMDAQSFDAGWAGALRRKHTLHS
ncbi:MAG: hypothetical protein ACKO96_04460, partial [Flammeovirgaceae bacterium]